MDTSITGIELYLMRIREPPSKTKIPGIVNFSHIDELMTLFL